MVGLAAILAGLLFGCGIYLMLSLNTQRLAMGFMLVSNGLNLLVLAAGGIAPGAAPPFVGAGGGALADPLPQAFILTAIVISLAAVAFLFAMAARSNREAGTDRLDDRGGRE